ncbi:MAG TPA: ATP-binding protein, partial [Aggregicoccus sp.]|nr:ATP-binding protein [Aggregicoccus sp.]
RLEEILRIAVDKIGRVISTDRCSVVLVEATQPRVASVVATREAPALGALDLDLARYPELRRALETRQPVHVEDASRDPLMSEVRDAITPLGVRSILVQPLICQDDLVGALFLRMSRAEASFDREDQEFARAVAAALANSIRNAQLHTALRRKHEDLESAYVDRYRELSEANRRLKELNRFKDELIAVCSHDLRAPLQILLGHGRLMLDEALEPQQQSSVEAMVRQGRKILELVESLLEKGKGEAVRLSLEPRLVDLSQLCRESTQELEILAAERQVTLRHDCSETLMAIGDATKLHEVLQNLITNAIHHATVAGTVHVRAQRLKRPDGDAARVVVQDDGRGIPSDQLHLVFDRYRHGPGGTGLGLAICKEFVELHGGEIWAETPPEGGCAFVFTLPLAQQAQRALPQATPVAEQPRVLVIEDEPEVAAQLTEALRSRYRVELARDGQEGLAKARALHPDLVVMDVFLPRLDGLDCAVALKSSSDTADIPVILLSAHQGVVEKVRALNLGAVDYLTKPFQALELLARTERALQQRGSARAGLERRGGSDPVTGLFDHAGLVARLDQEISRSRRYERPLSVAVLRPERPLFDVPPNIGDVIRLRLRAPDILGHLGSGIFTVVLPECGEQASRLVIDRLLPDLAAATGTTYQAAVKDIAQDVDSVDRLLERLGALPPRA